MIERVVGGIEPNTMWIHYSMLKITKESYKRYESFLFMMATQFIATLNYLN